MITNINQLDLSKRYTYKDYLTWQFDEMVELIKGKISRMSPAPGRSHQRISNKLCTKIEIFLEGKACEVYPAPFDVRLPLPKKQQSSDKITTVLQPDISVICDANKLDDHGCLGAPDWVIEILSKGTSKKDLNQKFDIYQNAGVKEYWIVDPNLETIVPFILNEQGEFQHFRAKPYVKGENVPVRIFPNFEIPTKYIFHSNFNVEPRHRLV